MSTERIALKFTPEWEGPIEGWSVNFIKKQLWRCAPEYDFSDMYQEAWLCFNYCVEHYPHVVDPPHFMSIFKRAMWSTVVDIANSRTKFRTEISAQVAGADGESVDLFDLVGADTTSLDEATLHLLINDAPPLIRKALIAALDPEVGSTQRNNGLRETTEQFLHRLVGQSFNIDPQFNLTAQFQRWFKEKLHVQCA